MLNGNIIKYNIGHISEENTNVCELISEYNFLRNLWLYEGKGGGGRRGGG